MLVSHMLYRTSQSSKAHRTKSVVVMGHELTMEMNNVNLDVYILLFVRYSRHIQIFSVGMRGTLNERAILEKKP